MMRLGVIGCGSIHSTHCDAIEKIDGATLAAVYDVKPEKAAAAAEARGAVAAKTLDELFGLVDAVTICVPSGLHAQIGIQAARAGKHVLSEKPIDVMVDRAEGLVKACREAGVKLGVISQHRFANSVRELQAAAQGGAFGKLIAGDCCTIWYRTQAYYDADRTWRGTVDLDGGSILNQGVHYVDLIQWIMGGAKSVQAQMRTANHDIESEDIINVLVEWQNGAIGTLKATTCAYPGYSERIEVYGSYGAAVIEADRIKVWKVDPDAPKDPNPYGKGATYHPTPKEEVFGGNAAGGSGASDPTAIWGEQHRLQIEDFVRAVADDRDPFVTGDAALEPLRIIQAAYTSAREGGRVVELAR